MNPQAQAMKHPAAPPLKHYADHSCPVKCGEDWSQEHIEVLLRQGPHITAKDPDAILALHEETEGKIKNHYSKVVLHECQP